MFQRLGYAFSADNNPHKLCRSPFKWAVYSLIGLAVAALLLLNAVNVGRLTTLVVAPAYNCSLARFGECRCTPLQNCFNYTAIWCASSGLPLPCFFAGMASYFFILTLALFLWLVVRLILHYGCRAKQQQQEAKFWNDDAIPLTELDDFNVTTTTGTAVRDHQE
jgi:hypothetical protein